MGPCLLSLWKYKVSPGIEFERKPHHLYPPLEYTLAAVHLFFWSTIDISLDNHNIKKIGPLQVKAPSNAYRGLQNMH